MKNAGIFKRGIGFFRDVLFQLMLFFMLALCVYFFFHFETVTARLTSITATVVAFYLIHKGIDFISRKMKGC
ncbi:hypothetical protein ACWA06_00540 [Serratia rhizosphaerae]|uniref:hypothetical protein n=1 Tax=unclassified Serratia (in: enterobacteria) TaxID=2647522 RepID=UPI000CF72216|nr:MULTISPECIES: hypothetical protein [unclassified Serratia (in: enterobacteria)]AVJ17706.1 hypothetical protein CLM71_11460 [Serratia sp. MYb239]MBU3892386.1 hypothetical protein [Serratia rubidaea]QPT11336.1 hypothetical protein I6G37_12315 [Serratia rubidaea]SQJ19886.1 Uncharacterised protein [Serratia rubidaea]